VTNYEANELGLVLVMAESTELGLVTDDQYKVEAIEL
jgi:hypothetical protein